MFLVFLDVLTLRPSAFIQHLSLGKVEVCFLHRKPCYTPVDLGNQQLKQSGHSARLDRVWLLRVIINQCNQHPYMRSK